jgi:hypothetical protein
MVRCAAVSHVLLCMIHLTPNAITCLAGFAVLSWGPNGVFIFMVSLVNLVPRSIATHVWYMEKFGSEYPADRAYIVPFVF